MLTTSLTLLMRLKENKPQAWARFASLYTPLLLYWAKRLSFQPADAADLCQEILVKLFRELPKYERGEGQSFRGWLNRLTSNLAIDFRRRKATRSLQQAETLQQPVVANPISEIDEIEEMEYRSIVVRRCLDLIRRDFNDSTWQAFTNLMIDGCNAAETAAKLNISENAVYMARHRVLTRLRLELDGLLE